VNPNTTGRTSVGGAPVLSQQQQEMAQKNIDTFTTEGKKEYDAATATLMNLGPMNQAFDKLAAPDPKTGTPGFTVSGSMGGLRNQIASAVDTVQQITGAKDLSFDPGKVASAEMLNELTNRMGTNLLQQTLGSQREAAETIHAFTGAVPGIDDTFLGAKLKMASIAALSQRAVDQYQYGQAYAAAPGRFGNPTGYDTEFNKQQPPEKLAENIMSSVGLTPNGKFKSFEAAQAAWHAGLVTKAQAKAIGLDTGGN
jgi:hypothetical protein